VGLPTAAQEGAPLAPFAVGALLAPFVVVFAAIIAAHDGFAADAMVAEGGVTGCGREAADLRTAEGKGREGDAPRDDNGRAGRERGATGRERVLRSRLLRACCCVWRVGEEDRRRELKLSQPAARCRVGRPLTDFSHPPSAHHRRQTHAKTRKKRRTRIRVSLPSPLLRASPLLSSPLLSSLLPSSLVSSRREPTKGTHAMASNPAQQTNTHDGEDVHMHSTPDRGRNDAAESSRSAAAAAAPASASSNNPAVASAPSSANGVPHASAKPKSILKKPGSRKRTALVWNESNLANNEIERIERGSVHGALSCSKGACTTRSTLISILLPFFIECAQSSHAHR